MAIKTQTSKGLLTIQIDRPDRKNSFTEAMYTAIGDAFEQAYHASSVKAVLIKGHPDCFSAGNDLGDFVNNPPKGPESAVFRFLRLISQFPKPVAAQVEGVAVGIGTTLLLHCDLVYASDKARFSVPFAKLGLCPEAGSSLILPALAGYQKAAELLLLGDLFSAEKAKDCGIVTDVLSADALEEHVQKQISKLLQLPLPSLMTTKRLMKSHTRSLISQAMNEEGDQFIAMLGQPQAQEAFQAFAEKRAPDFLQFENRS